MSAVSNVIFISLAIGGCRTKLHLPCQIPYISCSSSSHNRIIYILLNMKLLIWERISPIYEGRPGLRWLSWAEVDWHVHRFCHSHSQGLLS